MIESQKQYMNELRRQLQGLEDTLSEEQKLLQARNQRVISLSSSAAEVTNFIHEEEKELEEAQRQLDIAERRNKVVHAEQLRLDHATDNLLKREEYIKELTEADENLKGTQTEVDNLTNQIIGLTNAPKDADTQSEVVLVSLIAILDDLKTSLNRSIQRVPVDEDIRTQELLKAICELSRERERALGYCMRKKREVTGVIGLKKQRTSELILESQRNLALVRDGQDAKTMGVVERIQVERRTLEEEVVRIQATNERMWEALRDTRYSSDTIKSGEYKREVALSANDALRGSSCAEVEKENLKEQLKLFDTKKQKLQRITDDLRTSMNKDMEKHAVRLKDLRREVHFQQRESHRIEGENRKIKALCDSLAATLDSRN